MVGAILDGRGRPICCDMWSGNVTDVTSLQPVVKGFTERFGIRSLCIVADRGMVSKDTIKELERPLMDRNQSFEWQDIKRDLSALQQIDVAMNDEPMTLRSELRGCCNEVLKAAGVAVPQRVQFK